MVNRTGGAVAASGVTEEEINLEIALKLRDLLEEAGAEVILTRTDEYGISGLDDATIRQKHRTDLQNRVKIGNESEADIFVSIHLNKIPQTQYSGWQTFFKQGDEDSQKLAEAIQQGLNESIDRKNTREATKISGIYIVDRIQIPMTIVECGFLSNYEELQLLITDEHQQNIAQGVYVGIKNYFKQFH